MSSYREIVTKAIVGKGKKKSFGNYLVNCDIKPNTVLGCWVINHTFKGTNNLGKVNLIGEFDVNVWYSYDNDTKTGVSSQRFNYTDVINVPLKENAKLGFNDEILVECLKQPTVTDVKIEDGNIKIKVEKELGVEIIGDTTVKVAIEDDYDDYEEIFDEDADELNINVDNIKEDYLSDVNK